MLGMARGFGRLGIAAFDLEAGEELVRQGEAAAQRTGNPYVIGAVSIAHGRVLGRTGRTDAAAERFAAAVSRFAEIGDERLSLAARSDLGHALRRGGRLDEAATAYRATIGGWVRLGHRGAVANQLENMAFVAIDRGEPERAARLLGAAEAIRGGDARWPRRARARPPVERLRPGCFELAAFETEWQVGRLMSQAEAVAFALAA
jgi:hypothetical protein